MIKIRNAVNALVVVVVVVVFVVLVVFVVVAYIKKRSYAKKKRIEKVWSTASSIIVEIESSENDKFWCPKGNGSARAPKLVNKPRVIKSRPHCPANQILTKAIGVDPKNGLAKRIFALSYWVHVLATYIVSLLTQLKLGDLD